jgi:hypothetical protein
MGGGGVIPVALHNGQLHFLFGQENDVIKDATKNQDWGDFGGSAKPGESEMDTCVREGAEELNGFYGNKRDFRALLLKNQVLKLTYDTRVTYLMRVDYDDRLPFYFNNNYRFIKETANLRSIAAHPENGYFEKSHVRWFTLDDLKRERGAFREYFRNFLDMIAYRAPEIRRLMEKRSNKRSEKRGKRSDRKRSNKRGKRSNKRSEKRGKRSNKRSEKRGKRSEKRGKRGKRGKRSNKRSGKNRTRRH